MLHKVAKRLAKLSPSYDHMSSMALFGKGLGDRAQEGSIGLKVLACAPFHPDLSTSCYHPVAQSAHHSVPFRPGLVHHHSDDLCTEGF